MSASLRLGLCKHVRASGWNHVGTHGQCGIYPITESHPHPCQLSFLLHVAYSTHIATAGEMECKFWISPASNSTARDLKAGTYLSAQRRITKGWQRPEQLTKRIDTTSLPTEHSRTYRSSSSSPNMTLFRYQRGDHLICLILRTRNRMP